MQEEHGLRKRVLSLGTAQKRKRAQDVSSKDSSTSGKSKRSFISRVVHKVVPCVSPNNFHDPPSPVVPDTPLPAPESPPSASRSTSTSSKSEITVDREVVVPPPHTLLPVEETDGVTSGAVQPPGSTGEHLPQVSARIVHRNRDSEDGDSATTTEDQLIYNVTESTTELDEIALEAKLIAQGGSGIPTGPDGEPRPLLPPILPEHAGRKCLVLDLDETLVHSSFKPVPNADFVVPVEIEFNWHHFHVLKRPGVDEFLRRMGELYEIVVFTASLSKYADPVLDKLDVHKVVTHRLFRESCYSHRGNYVKDLSQLGRPTADTIILDNSPASYIFHTSNAVPVSSWFNDPHDAELADLVPFLGDLSGAPDVTLILNGKM